MSDHDKDARLHSWARSASDRPAPAQLRHQVLDIPTTEPTTSRRRWLWFLPRPKPTAGAADEHDRAGRPSIVITIAGGRHTMFSATNLVGIAATIAVIGAVTLALPTEPQQADPPLAAQTAEPGELSTFTSEMNVLSEDRYGTAEHFDWGVDKPGEQWTMEITSDDPRMTGLATGFQNVYEVGPVKTRLQAWTGRLFTDEGSWLESTRAYQDPESTGLTLITYSVGEGSYEGLAAVTLCERPTFSSYLDCHGIISDVGWPDFPPDAPTEIGSAQRGG